MSQLPKSYRAYIYYFRVLLAVTFTSLFGDKADPEKVRKMYEIVGEDV